MKKARKINKKFIALIIIVLAVSALVGGLLVSSKSDSSRDDQRGPRPQGKSEAQFLYQEVYYSCSKPISGEWIDALVGQLGEPGYYFKPANMQDLEKFCRIDSVIEYHAVIDILEREDVNKVIEKYDTTEAWVRALGHRYIHDKDYLNRILPAYSNTKIDCIIVVHSPEGTRFFIENGEVHKSHSDHKYIEVPANEFLASLNKAPDSDINNFWLGLH